MNKYFRKLMNWIRVFNWVNVLQLLFVIWWGAMSLTFMLNAKVVITIIGYVAFIAVAVFLGFYCYMEIGSAFALKSKSSAKNTKCVIDENSKSTGNGKIRYILDSSAFFLLNKFAMAKEKSIDDIVHGDIFIDESISVLCEAIESRLCYVTQKTYEEIERAEASGRISAGVTKWVYDNFFTLNYKVSPERYESLMSIEDVEDGKTYKAKYFNLVWSAIRLMASLECQVVIVSTSKRFVNLALANKVLVKDLTELDTL